MPIREYLCNYCGHQFEELNYSGNPEVYGRTECRCGSKAELLPSVIGGYTGSSGGASTRPKNSTAMPSKRAFTKHPGNQGEPESKSDSEHLDFFPGGD